MGSIRQSNQNDTNNTTIIFDSLISIEYSPMQCDTTPWADWLANSQHKIHQGSIRTRSDYNVLCSRKI